MPFGSNEPTLTGGDDALAVLVDENSGREYYVSLMDSFDFQGQEYTVIYNYEPEDGRSKAPEIVLMRSYRQADGTRYFSSIRKKKELEMVFEIFYERFSDRYSE
ncbi:MAG: DUF1292 domain-containing protein [Eubacteriales bacterium]|nr:DUF1292 domain-containing protein [Eubacteriales bacterium]